MEDLVKAPAAAEKKLRAILDDAEAHGLSDRTVQEVWKEVELRHLAPPIKN